MTLRIYYVIGQAKFMVTDAEGIAASPILLAEIVKLPVTMIFIHFNGGTGVKHNSKP